MENCKVLNSNIYSVNRSEYAKNNKKDKSNMKLVGGAIAGYSHNSTISKCISRLNTVSAKSTYLIYAHAVGLGGIVGHADAGSVSECYSTSTIEGGKKDGSRYSSAYAYITKVDTAYLGGIVGQSTGCTITACFNTGSISGYAKNSSTSTELLSSEKITTNNRYYIYTAVNNSNNTKKITTFYNCYIGGIVGNSNSSVSNCYNTGTLTSYSPASITKYVYGFGAYISGLRQCAFYIEQTGAVVTVNNICGNNCTKDKCYTNKSIYSGIPSYKATVLFGPCYSDYSGHYGDWESFEWNTTTISDALNKKYFNEDNVWLSNTYNSTDIRTYVEDSAVYKLTIERNPRYPQISLKTVGYAGTVNSSDHSAISLKTITFSFLYNDATTGLVVSSNALSPSYFAVDSNINGGLPHLKCFYWQDNVGDLTSNPDPTPTPDPTPGPKPEIM